MNYIEMIRARGSRWRLAAGALLGVVMLGACDGENLFNPEENPYTALHVSLSGGSGGVAGDTLRFLVSGDAPNNLARFEVSVRGAVIKDTSLVASGRQSSALVKIVLPMVLNDTLLFVSARAVDNVGNVSQPDTGTFVVSAPPVIASLTGGEVLVPGGSATLRVRALGLRALSQMTVVTSGAVPFSNQTVALAPVTDVSRDFAIAIPSSPADTLVQVSVTVRDVSGLTSTRSFTLPIQVSAPVITAVLPTPAPATPGGTLSVYVQAEAMRGVKTLLARIRVDGVAQEQSFPVSGNTSASHTFTFQLPANLTAPSVIVEGEVVDRGSDRAILSTEAFLATGDPVVDSLQVSASVPLGGTLDVRAFTRGPRPLKDLTIRVRGGINTTFPTAITPSMTTATTDLFVPISAVVSSPDTWSCGATTCSTTATVEASVSDQAGRVSAWSAPITIVITNLPKPAESDESP